MERRTWSPKPVDIERRWYVVDAEGKTLGRLATAIATTLRGKHKPTFASHMDSGDFVIVLNAEKIEVTGNKEVEKTYYRHSGYPGGLSATPLRDMRAKHPDRIIRNAVRGMLPKNALGEQQLRKLKVYVGGEHPHASHKPEELTV